MKSLLASLTALAVLPVAASAADLPRRGYAPPVFEQPPAFTWTGFYAGAWGGYAFGSAQTRDINGYTDPTFAYRYDANGGAGGATVGANWQFRQFVVGLEGTAGYVGLSGAKQYGPFAGNPARIGDSVARIDGAFVGTATGRVGYAFNNVLFFAKGGYAYGGFDASYTDSNPIGRILVSGTKTSFGSGWTIGGGVEYAFLPNWSAKLEYDYYDFGSVLHVATTDLGVPRTFGHELTTSIISVGVNYRFGSF